MSDEEQPEVEQPRISPIFSGLDFGRTPIIPPGLADIISQVTPMEFETPDFVIDDSHWRAADAAEETAATVGEMRAAMEAMLRLTARNVEMAEEARKDAARTERFTRAMAWASTIIAIASLGAAVAAIVVAA